jgi:hypothetical protein
MVDTFPSLFWGYTFFFFCGALLVVNLFLRVKKLEKLLEEKERVTKNTEKHES